VTDRIDDLLERALADGAIPADATDDERAEVERLRANAVQLTASRASLNAEADASMPTARARFERFVAAQQVHGRSRQAPRAARRAGFFGWFAGGLRTYAAATAVLAVVVLAALLAPVVFDGAETASAQVLVPGDYVEFEAVAGDSVDGALGVSADFGEVQVVVDDQTHVVDATGNAPAQIGPGRHVVIAGVVGDDLRVRARTVAIADSQVERPDQKRPRPLEELRDQLIGRVVAVAFGADGRPRIVLAAPNDSLVINVQPESLEAFLNAVDAPVGSAVRVIRLDGVPRGVFGVELAGDIAPATPDPGQPERPRILTFAGVVTGRTGAIVTIETELRGPVQVRVTLDTQFRIGDPSVLAEEVRGERVIGRFVTVQAVPDLQSQGGLVAVTVLVGREADSRTR
jgi:hypothetical protein